MSLRSRFTSCRFVSTAAVATIAFWVSAIGCQPIQTFPPTVGRAAFDANLPPMPDLCVLAITTGHSKSSVADDAIIYNLPPGMNRAAWRKVDKNLPQSARAAQTGDKSVVSVEEIRIDGGTAQVDVVVPKGEIYQSLTVHMTGSPFGPWRVTYVQPWSLRTATPTPNSPWKEVSATSADTPLTSGVER